MDPKTLIILFGSGLGFSAVLVSFFVSFYYNVIIGWAFHFLISSFNYKLPWKVNMPFSSSSDSSTTVQYIVQTPKKKISGVGWCMVKVTGIVGKWLGYELDLGSVNSGRL